MSANLEKVLHEVRTLTPDELVQVKRTIDELLAAEDETPAMRLQRKLFEAGLISEIKQPLRDIEAFRRYRPAEVKGKPVSETIIEERR